MLLPLAVHTVIWRVPIFATDPALVWNGLGFLIFTRSPIANSCVASGGVSKCGETALGSLCWVSVSGVRRVMTSVCLR
jgi:hypothetical protein